ncbi:hypothetical protein PHET_10248 [Paragonimus heterotremus]|uniref:Uncharacterized protein n=1 Tax=Paragonimus heterotremus TaxID=100268 RepID=A0A8J4T387_9TREM|nr:hypothetical protein PHET_10248 [Paragonimus heterotremus]
MTLSKFVQWSRSRSQKQVEPLRRFSLKGLYLQAEFLRGRVLQPVLRIISLGSLFNVGSGGGQLSPAQLRLMLSDLGCLVVPHHVVISNVDQKLSADGEPIGCKTIPDEVDLMIDQVEYIGNAIKCIRSSTGAEPPKVHSYL